MVYPDKVVAITGAARGIGFGIARVFVDAGARVALCDHDAASGAEALAVLNQQRPGAAHFYPCDASRHEQVQRFIDQAVHDLGRLDCLINNVGVHPKHQRIDCFTVEDVRRLLDINVMSHVAATIRALPHLRRVRGSVINIGSLTSLIGEDGGALYAMSKASMNAFTKGLAIEEAHYGVRVNCVLPGNIRSDGRIRGEMNHPKGAKAYGDWLDSHQPVGRSGTNEEVGTLCLFLASDAASFISGTEQIISFGAELGYGIKSPPGVFRETGAMFHAP